MSRVILALLVLVAVASAFPNNALEQRNCSENEEFSTCASACEPNCNSSRSEICTMECTIGCQCKTGYFRNGSGNCVQPQQC